MSFTDDFIVADDGARLFCRVVGHGPQITIVPNLTYLWEDFQCLANSRTLVFYDVRHRGRSEVIHDAAKLSRGIEHDLEDLDAVRRHVHADRVNLVAHSYLAAMILLYALRHPAHVDHLVPIGAPSPDPAATYPPHLTNVDDVLRDTTTALAQLQRDQPSMDPAIFRARWSVLMRTLFVADPADADRLRWWTNDSPAEPHAMVHLAQNVFPSLLRAMPHAETLSTLRAPTLVVHGRFDRQAPYGGGRHWASRLPDARLLTVDRGAHVPWIEAPDEVFSAIGTFLDGHWPASAERVTRIDPIADPA